MGGLVSQVTNSTISNSSFTGRITNTYDTRATYQIGGLVGKLSGVSALIDRSISSIDMATNANTGDQVVGGIAGVVDKKATISNSYVEGNLNNVNILVMLEELQGIFGIENHQMKETQVNLQMY